MEKNMLTDYNQRKNFKGAVQNQVKIEVEVKKIVGGSDNLLNLPYYIIFGKQVYKIACTHKGETASEEVKILVKKWAKRGLFYDVLDKIAAFYLPCYPYANLMLFMPLNSDTNDYSLREVNGTNEGVTFIPGKIGSCGHFDGSSRVTIPNAQWNNLKEFTIMCWAKIDDYNAYGIIGNSVDWETCGWGLLWHFWPWGGDKNFAFYVCIGGGVHIDIFSPVLLTNTWYHVAAVKTKTESRLFIDGVRVAAAPSGNIVYDGLPDKLCLGERKYGADTLRGDLDHVKCWDVALSDERVLREASSLG